MAFDLRTDPRLDPRIKQFFEGAKPQALGDVANRDELLAEEFSPAGEARYQAVLAFLASLTGKQGEDLLRLRIETRQIGRAGSPNANLANIALIRPDTSEILPCVFYIHGGGMAVSSAMDECYAPWGRYIASRNVAVAMVDFRNSVRPSSVQQTAPFPAGLSDCVEALKWLLANSEDLKLDRGRLVVAGDSGGANLALAVALILMRSGQTDLVKGIYAISPFIAGQWPDPRYPSSSEFGGIIGNIHNNRARMAYGIKSFDERNPLAWPGFCKDDDVTGFPATVISVNECDPFRDEGIAFYRLLLRNNVRARCRQIMGTTHAIEIFSFCCPEISNDLANHIVQFCYE